MESFNKDLRIYHPQSNLSERIIKGYTTASRRNILNEKYQKVQTSSYKINPSWGCNAGHGDYS